VVVDQVVMDAGVLVVLVATDHRGATVDKDAMLVAVVALLVVAVAVLVVLSTTVPVHMATSG
tara:strand:+ start:261 stop:446 length:186 start_codon:yes stop_codon:yes gene_type:complete